jgi:hypothetical protein
MSVRENIPPNRRARKLASAAILAIVIAMIGGGALLIHHAFWGPKPKSYAADIEDARRAGVPVSAKALQAPLPPPEQNAAPIYTKLTDLLASHPLAQEDKIVEFVTTKQMPSKEQFERVRRALKHRAELLALIHRATARPQCVFLRDWSYPNAVLLKEVAPMREATRLLIAESALLVHDGKPMDAVNNQTLGFTIARHIAPEHYLTAHMTAVAVDSMTLLGLQKILYIAGSDPAVAKAVRSAIENEWRPHSLARAFEGEAGMHVVDLQILRTQNSAYLNQYLGNTATPPLHMSPQELSDFVDENGRVLLRLERPVISAADLPNHQANAALRRASDQVENDMDHRHVLVLVLFFDYGNLAVRQATLQATAEVTRTAAALLAWKGRHGSFPPILADAMTPLPMDPFDGMPLRYRREGHGFVVYSGGADGKFAGGVPTKKARQNRNLIPLSVPFLLRGTAEGKMMSCHVSKRIPPFTQGRVIWSCQSGSGSQRRPLFYSPSMSRAQRRLRTGCWIRHTTKQR